MVRHQHPRLSPSPSNFTSLSSPSESIDLLDEHEEKESSQTASDVESNESYSSSVPSLSYITNPPRLPSTRLSSSQIASFLGRIAHILIPSFLTSRQGSQNLLFPTAYLDGLRGLAALFVFFCHYTYTSFVITEGFGYYDTKTNNQNLNPLQLPIVRLLYSGPPMVCIFFVISGYALSLKPLKQIHSRSYNDLLATLSSSVFRRGLRLFLPTIASTFMVFIMLRLGIYEPSRAIVEDTSFHRNKHEIHPARLDGFFVQLADWLGQMFSFIAVFDWNIFAGSTWYDVHLWTIPVEFRSSLMLFVTIIALARLRPAWRFALLFGIWSFVFRKGRWELVLFFSGMAIAELDLITAQNGTLSDHFPIFKRYRSIAWNILAIVSLYLMSQPDDHYESTPGFIWLGQLIPNWFSEGYRFYQTLGSITLVLSLGRHTPLQAPLNHPVVQYFGKISYALYLVHGPVMHSIGYPVQAFIWRSITGYESPNAYIGGFVISAMVNFPLVFWVADVFWRVVDGPTVKFARWLETAMIVDDRAGEGIIGVSRGRATFR